MLAIVTELLLDNEIGAEVLAWLSIDYGGYLVVGTGPKDDPTRPPITGARHKRPEIDTIHVDQSVTVDSHLAMQRRHGASGYGGRKAVVGVKVDRIAET